MQNNQRSVSHAGRHLQTMFLLQLCCFSCIAGSLALPTGQQNNPVEPNASNAIHGPALVLPGLFLYDNAPSSITNALPPTTKAPLPTTKAPPPTTKAPPPIAGRNSLPDGFSYLYVNINHTISHHLEDPGTQFEVAGSPNTSAHALAAAARVVRDMTRYMGAPHFRLLCQGTSVGVFTKEEKLTIYPSYYSVRNDNCNNSCEGKCRVTCSSDNRKYEDLVGLGGKRAVVLDANVLCTDADPYKHKENILAHEFTHSIHTYALDRATKQRILNAYESARVHRTWLTSSYAMSNALEYFAEASTVFLGVNRYSAINAGGMNVCGTHYCANEREARLNLRNKDRALYDILVEVFTGHHPDQLSGLTICPTT